MKLPESAAVVSGGDPLLKTPAEIAAQLKVTQETLANWRTKGQGPDYLRVGGQIRYEQRDVASWLNSRKGGQHD